MYRFYTYMILQNTIESKEQKNTSFPVMMKNYNSIESNSYNLKLILVTK